MENKKVRRIILISMTVILTVLLAACSYLYVYKYKPSIEKEPDLSNVYVPENAKELTKGEKVLLAEFPQAEFKLFSAGDYIIVSYKGQEAEFTDWSSNITKETPEIFWGDFDSDGAKEIVVKALKEIDAETREHIYNLYVLFFTEGENGKIDFSVKLIDRADWYESFSKSIRAEMNQPAGAMNRVQFAMNAANESIKYDAVTGIITDGHGWFARALCDNTGKYYHFENWEKGMGTFVVNSEKGQIDAEIEIYATYSGLTHKQDIGSIVCGLVVSKDGVNLRSKSLYFRPNEKFAVTDPTTVSQSDWSSTIKNTASNPGRSDKMIDKVAIDCNIAAANKTASASFSSKNNNSSSVDRVVVSNNEIKVYAKDGFTFAKTKIVSRDYSALVSIGNGIECDACFDAAVTTENGVSVIVYKLDKSYPFEEIKNVKIRFGV